MNFLHFLHKHTHTKNLFGGGGGGDGDAGPPFVGFGQREKKTFSISVTRVGQFALYFFSFFLFWIIDPSRCDVCMYDMYVCAPLI